MEEQLKNLFIELVKFSKDVSPEIWAILVRQSIIIGIMYLLTVVFSLICFLKGLQILKERPKWALIDDDINIVGGVWTGVFAFILLIAMICLLSDGIPHLFNPEYYALMDLKP